MILVIAGVNGSGKSSILGSNIRARGGEYFNQDEATQILLGKKTLTVGRGQYDSLLKELNKGLTLDEANSKAWEIGLEMLKRSINENLNFSFETTLGGKTICAELHRAIDKGIDVEILYCGLSSPELHIARVAQRVARGGHDIPEKKIRERWQNSINNLAGLISRCAGVAVYDNSRDLEDGLPCPVKLFAMRGNNFTQFPVANMPDWAIICANAAMRRFMARAV